MFMSQIRFDEEELTLVSAFAEKTRQETIDVLKEMLDVLDTDQNETSADEMILLISSTVEKLQQIEDRYFYSIDLQQYLNNIREDDYGE